MGEGSGEAAASGWVDKLPVLLAAMNPLLLLVVGWFLNAGLERNKLELEATRAQIEQNSARLQDLKTTAETTTIGLQQRVDKVKVISDFINDLSGNDERRRSLAIEAIFIALPDEATRLVKVIQKFGGSGDRPATADVAAAQDALSGTRDRLVADMFSLQRPTRVEALATLQRGWLDDPEVIGRLIDRANQDVASRAATSWAKPADDRGAQQLASIYNTAQFLTQVRGPANPALQTKISDFLTAATPNSEDTKRIVAAHTRS